MLKPSLAPPGASTRAVASEALRTVVEVIPCGVAIHDRAGRLVFANQAALALSGLEAGESAATLTQLDELAARYDVVDPTGEALPLEAWPLSRAARGEPFVGLELEVRDRRSRRSWVARFDGAPLGELFVTTILDATEASDAERALRDSEARYHALLQSALDAIAVFPLPAPGAALRPAREVNGQACEVLGYERAELLDLPPAEVSELARDPARLAAVCAQLRGTGEVVVEDQLRTRNGAELPVEISLTRVDLGARPHVVAIARDLTTRREAERLLRQSERQFRSLAESIGHMVWTADPDGRLEYVNARLTAFIGRDLQELLADPQAAVSCLHPDDREITQMAWRRALAVGEEYWAEVRIRRAADGVWIWHRVHGAPLRRGGDVERWYGTCTNIHDRVLAEQQLLEMAAHLEQQVCKRTAKLHRQAEQLRRLALELTAAEQRERKRLAAMIHDHLQQLLVAARMRVGLLGGGAPDPALLQGTDQLLGEALQATRTLTAELRPPVLYEDGVLAALRWLAQRMAQQHALQLELHTEPEAEPGDEQVRAFLFEAARELLFNTVKHAGALAATLRVERAGDEVRLTVEDRGRGFDLARLDPGAGGSGLGLFSIRERLAALGGHAAVCSRPGEGTRITLSVPLLHDSSQSRGAARGPRRADSRRREAHREGRGARIRVLLADDHRLVREGIANLLAADPRIEVVAQAADGVEALELVETHAPSLVVLDVNMPRVNGIEAARRIKQRWPGIAVIGISVHDDEGTARSMREAGATRYISKGGDPRELLKAVLELASAG